MGVYTNLEDKWYDFVDYLDQFIPIGVVVDKVDRVVPSFLVFIGLFIIILILLLGVIVVSTGNFEISNPKEVIVLSSDNLPVKGVKLTADSDCLNGASLATTNESGKATINVCSNLLVLKAEKDNYQTYRQTITTTENQIIIQLLPITLSFGPRNVLIRVLDDAQNLINEAIVEITCDSNTTTLTDQPANGWLIPVSCTNTAQIKANATGYQQKIVTLTNSEERKIINLEETDFLATVYFEVTSPAGGEKAEIVLKNEFNETTPYTTNSLGTGSTKINAGTYSYTATSVSTGEVKTGNFEISAKEQKIINIDFETDPSTINPDTKKYLAFEIINDQNQAVPSAKIEVYFSDGNKLPTRTTLQSGRTSQTPILDETTSLVGIVDASGYEKKVFNIELQDKDEYQKIQISSGGAILKVNVVDDLDRVETKALVQLKYQNFLNFSILADGYTDSNGSITIENLPAGNYQIYSIDKAKKDEITESISLTKNEEKEITLTLVTGTGKLSYRFYNPSGSSVVTDIIAYEKTTTLSSVFSGQTLLGKYITNTTKKGTQIIIKTDGNTVIPTETIPFMIDRTQREKEVYLRTTAQLPNTNTVQVLLNQIYTSNPIDSDMKRSTYATNILPEKEYWFYFDVVLNNENEGPMLANFYAKDQNFVINNIYSIDGTTLLMSKDYNGRIIDTEASNSLVTSNAVQANVKISNIKGKKVIPVILQIKMDANATNLNLNYQAVHFNQQSTFEEVSFEYETDYEIGEEFCIRDCPNFLFSNYLEWTKTSGSKVVSPITELQTKLWLGDQYKTITKIENISDTAFSNIELVHTLENRVLNAITFTNDANQIREMFNLSPFSTSTDKNANLILKDKYSSVNLIQTIEKMEGGENTLKDLDGSKKITRFTIAAKNQLVIEVFPSVLNAKQKYPQIIIKTRYNTSSKGVSANWYINSSTGNIASGVTDENGLAITNLDLRTYSKNDIIEFVTNDDEGALEGKLEITLNENVEQVLEVDDCLEVNSENVVALTKNSTTQFSIDSSCDVERRIFINTELSTSSKTFTIQPGATQTITLTATPRGELLGAYPVQVIAINDSRYIQLKHMDIIINDPESCFEIQDAIFDFEIESQIASKIKNNCFSGRKNNFYPKMNINTKSVELEYDAPGIPDEYNFTAEVHGMAIESVVYGFVKSDVMFTKAKGDGHANDVPVSAETAGETALANANEMCEEQTYTGEHEPKPEPELEINTNLPQYDVYQASVILPEEGSSNILGTTTDNNSPANNPNYTTDDWAVTKGETKINEGKISFEESSSTDLSSEGDSVNMVGRGDLPETVTFEVNSGPQNTSKHVIDYYFDHLHDVQGNMAGGMDRPPGWMTGGWAGVIEPFRSPTATVLAKKDNAKNLVATYLGEGFYYVSNYAKGKEETNWVNVGIGIILGGAATFPFIFAGGTVGGVIGGLITDPETAYISIQVDNSRVTEFLDMREAEWKVDASIIPKEGVIYRIGNYVADATPIPLGMDESQVHDHNPGESWNPNGSKSLFTAVCAIPNGFVNPERALEAEPAIEGVEMVILSADDPFVEYDSMGIIRYKIPEEYRDDPNLKLFLRGGELFAEYVGEASVTGNEINFILTKTNLKGKEYAILEVYDWVGNEVKKQSFQIKLEGAGNNCISSKGDIGFTGAEFVPNILLNWDWDTISEDHCKTTYCDATQFMISLFKKLEKIENLINTNKLTEIPLHTSYDAYLIKDTYNQNFLDDFTEYYSTTFANAAPAFNNQYKNFILDDKLEIDSNMPWGGKYTVEIELVGLQTNTNTMFDDTHPTQNIKVNLIPKTKAQNYSPLYELAFNGAIGEENRNGYGVVANNQAKIDDTINFVTNGNGEVNLNIIDSTTMSELQNGIVLDYNNSELKFTPSQPTPVTWKIDGKNKTVIASYSLSHVVDITKTNWMLTSSTIGGSECKDFENNANKYFTIKKEGDKFVTSWDLKNSGTIGLSTVLFTPEATSSSGTVSIIPSDGSGVMQGLATTQNNKNVILNYHDSIQNTKYQTLKGMLELIKEKEMCISTNEDSIKIFWNPEYLSELVKQVDAASNCGFELSNPFFSTLDYEFKKIEIQKSISKSSVQGSCFNRGSISGKTPRIISDGTCFKTSDGEAFFPIADTAWLLGRLTNSDIEQYIKTRSEQGFNVIKFDSSEGDYAKHDFIFDTLKKYNMYAETGPTVGKANGIAYVNRYKNRENIFAWIVGGFDDGASTAQVTQLVNSVKSADPTRLVSAHPKSGKSLISDHGLSTGIIDFYYVHKCNPGSISGLIQLETNRNPKKPVYLGEPVYEGTAGVCGCNSGCTASQSSSQINEAIRTGVAGISYGHHSIWSFNLLGAQIGGSPWKNALNSLGAKNIESIATTLKNKPDEVENTNNLKTANFPGTINDYILVQNSPSLSNFTEGITIEAMVYQTGRPGPVNNENPTGSSAIVSKGMFGEYWEYRFVIEQDGKLGFATGTNSYATSCTPVVTLNKWQHLAVTVDKTNNQIKFYVDGVGKNACGTVDYSFSSKGNNLMIGRGLPLSWQNASFYYDQFKGQLDNVRIWNRALTSEEINKSIQRKVNEINANRVAEWTFENGGVDSSGNSNNGNFKGAVNLVERIPPTPTITGSQFKYLADVDGRAVVYAPQNQYPHNRIYIWHRTKHTEFEMHSGRSDGTYVLKHPGSYYTEKTGGIGLLIGAWGGLPKNGYAWRITDPSTDISSSKIGDGINITGISDR